MPAKASNADRTKNRANIQLHYNELIAEDVELLELHKT